MTLSRVWTVVSTNWLREQIGTEVQKALSSKLRVLDVSYISDVNVDTYREAYLLGHIPQSVHFNLHKCVESTPAVPRNLPDLNCFTDYVQDLGIHRDTHIVAYDRFGPVAAYRTWWLFRLHGHSRISVLDGGLRKWLNDGLEITQDVPEVEKSDYMLKLNKSLLRNYDDVMNNLSHKEEQVVDARPIDSPSVVDDDIDGGYIPGSKFVNFNQLFSEQGTIKTEQELKELFDEAGVDLDQPMVASCLLGMTACGVAAAAHILGKENVPVYYGSYTEWKHRASDDLKARVKKS